MMYKHFLNAVCGVVPSAETLLPTRRLVVYSVIHFIEEIFHSAGYCLMVFKRTADIILLANQFYVCGKVCFRSKMGLFEVI